MWELTLTFAELISAWGGVLMAVMEAWRQMILGGDQVRVHLIILVFGLSTLGQEYLGRLMS